MMATIVTIAVIGEKISSLQWSCGNHFPVIVAFAVITVTMIFEVEKVISFLLQSVEIVFQLFDPYDRWAFLSDCQDHSDCRDCSVYMETRLYFNTK